MRKAGAKSYEKYSKILLKICKKKPISLEVFADNFKDMEKQALKINSWGKNIYVKIPVVNSKGKFTGQLIIGVLTLYILIKYSNHEYLFDLYLPFFMFVY